MIFPCSGFLTVFSCSSLYRYPSPFFFPNLSEAPASNLPHPASNHLVAHHGISAAHDLLQPGDHGSCMQLFGCDMTDGRFEDGVKMVKDEVKNGWIYFCQICICGRCLLVGVHILNQLLASMRDSMVRHMLLRLRCFQSGFCPWKRADAGSQVQRCDSREAAHR